MEYETSRGIAQPWLCDQLGYLTTYRYMPQTQDKDLRTFGSKPPGSRQTDAGCSTADDGDLGRGYKNLW